MHHEHVDKQLEDTVIQHTQREQANLIVLDPQKRDTHRFCVDVRRLNATTILDSHPLQRIHDFIDSLEEAHVCTSLDAL